MRTQAGQRVSLRVGLTVVVVVVLAALLVAGYVYALSERRRTVEIAGGEISTEMDPLVLYLAVGSCGGEPTVTEFVQSDAEVRIAVEATTGGMSGRAQCLDQVKVRLDEPLGDRLLIDGSHGQAVEVQQY